MSWVMFFFGYIAVCFLFYTIINRKKLDRKNYRIQIVTELFWIIIFIVAGILLI
jgi:hypothetical protein